MTFVARALPYSDPEVREIVVQAHDGAALELLRCPRDGAVLKVFFASFRPHRSGTVVHGVVHDDWGDVTSISVECPECGGARPRIDLTRVSRKQ